MVGGASIALGRGWKEGEVQNCTECLLGVITSSHHQGQELNATLFIVLLRAPGSVNDPCFLYFKDGPYSAGYVPLIGQS